MVKYSFSHKELVCLAHMLKSLQGLDISATSDCLNCKTPCYKWQDDGTIVYPRAKEILSFLEKETKVKIGAKL